MKYPPNISVIVLEISHEAETKALALEPQVQEQLSQNIKTFNKLSKEDNEDELSEEDNEDEKYLGSRESGPTVRVQTIINKAQSLIYYDLCDKTNYIIYLQHFVKIFAPTGQRGTVLLYRSAEQAQFDMHAFLKTSLESLESRTSAGSEVTTYYVLKKRLFKMDSDANKKRTFILIKRVDEMNRLKAAKYFKNLSGLKISIVMVEKAIQLLSRYKDSTTGKLRFEGALRYITDSLIRLRTMYGLNGKDRCDRVTKLLEGETMDYFGNSYKLSDKELTDKAAMLVECRNKFNAFDPRRSRCIRLVKSRLNFNDVLKKDCTLKNRTDITAQRQGGKKLRKRPLKNGLGSKKNRHKKTQKHKKIVYGGNAGELIVLAFGMIIAGSAIMGTAAVGNPMFICGGVLLGVGVIIFLLMFGGFDDD
jgi:hypothetical protein